MPKFSLPCTLSNILKVIRINAWIERWLHELRGSSLFVCQLHSCALARRLQRWLFLFVVRHGVKHNESSLTWRVTAKKKCKFGYGINNQPLELLFGLFLKGWRLCLRGIYPHKANLLNYEQYLSIELIKKNKKWMNPVLESIRSDQQYRVHVGY